MIWILGLWQSFKTNRTAQVVALVAVLGAAVLLLDRCAARTMDAKFDQGRQTERVEAQTKTIERVEQANDTRRKIADPASRARYDECLQSARNPANCERFLSDRPTD